MLACLGLHQALSPHARKQTAPVAARTTDAPAFVSPLLPGNYRKAQEISKVNLPGYNASSLYSGFITIDAVTGSNSYFMFSTALSGRRDAPVLLWLNGGPGGTRLASQTPCLCVRAHFNQTLGTAPRRSVVAPRLLRRAGPVWH